MLHPIIPKAYAICFVKGSLAVCIIHCNIGKIQLSESKNPLPSQKQSASKPLYILLWTEMNSHKQYLFGRLRLCNDNGSMRQWSLFYHSTSCIFYAAHHNKCMLINFLDFILKPSNFQSRNDCINDVNILSTLPSFSKTSLSIV